MAYNLVAKELGILIFHAKAVILLVLIPLLQLDYHVNRLCILYALYTEQRLDIDNADTAKLDEMTGNIRCRTDQGFIADAADLDHIIADETVTALNQFQRCLTLAA